MRPNNEHEIARVLIVLLPFAGGSAANEAGRCEIGFVRGKLFSQNALIRVSKRVVAASNGSLSLRSFRNRYFERLLDQVTMVIVSKFLHSQPFYAFH
ncbi:MAG: hypothetical protein OXG15_08315 [Gammaproteobacteria bacterium]|nr:hypothetical protein [Gammaproteobacteria bacterium]